MRRRLILVFLLCLLFLSQQASAQDENDRLDLNLRRDFGFSLAGRIQGTFTLSASGPTDLVRVDFLVDNQITYQDLETPFEFKFHTADFELGVRTISAIGTTKDGEILKSEALRLEFISADEGWQSASKIVIPLLVFILIISALGIGDTSHKIRATQSCKVLRRPH